MCQFLIRSAHRPCSGVIPQETEPQEKFTVSCICMASGPQMLVKNGGWGGPEAIQIQLTVNFS